SGVTPARFTSIGSAPTPSDAQPAPASVWITTPSANAARAHDRRFIRRSPSHAATAPRRGRSLEPRGRRCPAEVERYRGALLSPLPVSLGATMTTRPSPALRARIENTIRFLAIDAVERAKSGHPGAPMGLAAAAFELWDAHLRFDPSDPDWVLRDRFVLSNGHASMLLYSLLHLFGFGVTLDDLRAFRQLGSKTPGHPEYGHTPGVETTTGPLGQGFATGVGMALAARLARARCGEGGPGHHFVYGIVSDGDLMEGVSAEAGSLAGHLGLGNLIYLYDDNRITIDGPTTLAFSEDVALRFAAQRWHVQKVDGNDVEAVGAAIAAAREETERPSLIVMRTTIGYGSPNLAGKSKTHGAPLGADEVRATKEAAGWPLEPDFLVPDDVRAYFAARAKEKRAEREAADARLERWRAADPEQIG